MKRNLKQKIASALIVSMMAGLTVSPAWGAENKPTWIFEGGVWHLYDEDGDLVKDGVKRQGGKWWAFNAYGAMLTDQLYFYNGEIQDDDYGAGDQVNSYIYPDGHMAENTWVALTEDGSYYTYDSGEICWYYFEGGGESGPGIMKRNEVGETTNKGQDEDQMFAWGDDGQMYAGIWLYVDADQGTILDEDTVSENGWEGDSRFLRYFQQEGYMAKGRNLMLDGFWYTFQDDGMVGKVIPVASDSDANFNDAMVTQNVLATAANADEHQIPREVTGIELISADDEPVINNTVEVVPGKPVTLTYQITLASASNVNIPGFRDKDHDIWLSLNKSGKTLIKDDRDESQIIVTYTPHLVKEEKIQLFIDNPEMASEPVTIIPKLTTAKEQETAVNNVMDSWQDAGFSASTVLDSIGEVHDSAESDEQEAEILRTMAESDSYQALSAAYAMENSIEEANPAVSEEASALLGGGKVQIAGSALNVMAHSSVQLKVDTSTDAELSEQYDVKEAFDLTFLVNSNQVDGELEYPVKITMPIPESLKNASNIKLFHLYDGQEVEVAFSRSGNTITFITNSFSPYVFVGDAEDTTEPGGSDDNNPGGGSSGGSSSSGSGGGGGSSSSSTSSAGTVITDPKKGQVNSVTGIITGSGDGYSNWVATTAEDGTVTWQLRYADGSMAAGSIVTREDGTTYEQVAWELINGAWYAFGADSIAKGGMIYDVDLGGYFYVDINSGMITGWAQIDGQWRYFNPVSDGKRGIMFTDSWIDGWYVDPNGIWDGQAQAQ